MFYLVIFVASDPLTIEVLLIFFIFTISVAFSDMVAYKWAYITDVGQWPLHSQWTVYDGIILNSHKHLMVITDYDRRVHPVGMKCSICQSWQIHWILSTYLMIINRFSNLEQTFSTCKNLLNLMSCTSLFSLIRSTIWSHYKC